MVPFLLVQSPGIRMVGKVVEMVARHGDFLGVSITQLLRSSYPSRYKLTWGRGRRGRKQHTML